MSFIPWCLNVLESYGVTVALFVGVFTFWMNARFERKKTVRRVLYYLIEIRHLFILSQSNLLQKVMAKYLSICDEEIKKVLPDETADLPQEAQQAIIGVWQYIFQLIAGNPTQLSSDYRSALDAMAMDKPLTAFRLRGDDALGQVLTLLQQLHGGYLTELHKAGANEEERKVVLDMMNKARAVLTFDMLSAIDGNVKYLALRGGVFLRIAIGSYLKSRPIEDLPEEVWAEIRKYAEVMATEIAKAMGGCKQATDVVVSGERAG